MPLNPNPEAPRKEEELDCILNTVPKKEEDKPLGAPDKSFWGDVNCLKEIGNIQDKIHNSNKHNKAFKLVYICIIATVAVYIFQSLKTTDKEITTSVMELLKAVIFSATGYIFAKNM